MIYRDDCITGARQSMAAETADLMICDPPFGIGETEFQHLYNRKASNVVDGYVQAPDDYHTFTYDWMTEVKRVMKPNASLYVVSGWTHLIHILNVIEELGFHTVNHLIWKYNFGVYTKRKYVSSHYHILYLTKSPKAKPTFNTTCRLSPEDRTEEGRSLLYQDMEDVWVINREYRPGEKKNCNKLPDALVEKMILYSSNAGDMVCDFFLGNFTTALVAKRLGRIPAGFELNPESFARGMEKLQQSVGLHCTG